MLYLMLAAKLSSVRVTQVVLAQTSDRELHG